MAFSYNPLLLTALDQVRFEVSDTENTATNPALLQDEEILAVLIRYSQNVLLTAARLCDRIAGTFARQGTLRVGDLMTSGMAQATYFRQLARDLRQGGSGSGNGPWRQDACDNTTRFNDPAARSIHGGASEDRPWIAIDR